MMAVTAKAPMVKVVGTNGQISLGKQYAGRQVLVEEREPGVWIVRAILEAHGFQVVRRNAPCIQPEQGVL